MKTIVLEIVRWVDDSNFPGWAECRLVDAEGQTHLFVEKVPVVTAEILDSDSEFPRPCSIACEVPSKWQDAKGRFLAKVDTTRPWGVASTTGQTTFVVLTSQVIDRAA